MGTKTSVILLLLNIVHTIIGLVLISASIWFLLEIQNITNLRDPDHYRLTTISWPEAIPWIFMGVGLFVLLISSCGCIGAKTRTRSLLKMYVASEILVVISAMTAVVVTLVLADSKMDGFIRTTMFDGFTYMSWNNNPQLKKSFGDIEERFSCCGASNPGQYKHTQPYRGLGHFPESCCGTSLQSYKGVCDFENEMANNRLGCIDITGYYAHKIVNGLCTGGVLIGLVGIINIITTILLLTSGKRQNTNNVITKEQEAGTLKC